MPRLVFCPTAARVAATASRMRAPTRAPLAAMGPALASALRTKSVRRHAMAGGEAMHVAGLERVELGEAGLDIGFRDAILVICHARRAPDGGGPIRPSDPRRSLGDVVGGDLLQAAPRRHAVDLQNGRARRRRRPAHRRRRSRRRPLPPPRRQVAPSSNRARPATGWPPCLTLVIQVEALRIIAATTRPRRDEQRDNPGSPRSRSAESAEDNRPRRRFGVRQVVRPGE